MTDSSNGMVSINRNIQETEHNIWPIRRGSICNKTEQEAAQILQLVPGQSISRNQRTEPLLVAMEQPLLFTGKDNNDNNNTNMEVCDLVSNSGKNQNSSAHTNTGIRDYSRPKKRQISSTQE
ncbi:hypothetical protein BB561_002207 [Smittium simulii]|uniref:Uncharacterized protein n=1 Tax=Smittium simulii TaxID=133385 RepID=A0A2T9YR94_9FUNG|nr:hypothetical protein BB561_002207 [Smittium simulii]